MTDFEKKVLEELAEMKALQLSQGNAIVEVQKQNAGIMNVLSTMLGELQSEAGGGEMMSVLETAIKSLEMLVGKLEKAVEAK